MQVRGGGLGLIFVVCVWLWLIQHKLLFDGYICFGLFKSFTLIGECTS